MYNTMYMSWCSDGKCIHSIRVDVNILWCARSSTVFSTWKLPLKFMEVYCKILSKNFNICNDGNNCTNGSNSKYSIWSLKNYIIFFFSRRIMVDAWCWCWMRMMSRRNYLRISWKSINWIWKWNEFQWPPYTLKPYPNT